MPDLQHSSILYSLVAVVRSIGMMNLGKFNGRFNEGFLLDVTIVIRAINATTKTQR